MTLKMLHPNEANYIPLNAGLGLQPWCFPTGTTTVTVYSSQLGIKAVVRFYKEQLSQLCRHKGDRGKERLKFSFIAPVARVEMKRKDVLLQQIAVQDNGNNSSIFLFVPAGHESCHSALYINAQ